MRNKIDDYNKITDGLKKNDYVMYKYANEMMKARIVELNNNMAKIIVLVNSKRGEESLSDVLEVPRKSLQKFALNFTHKNNDDQ